MYITQLACDSQNELRSFVFFVVNRFFSSIWRVTLQLPSSRIAYLWMVGKHNLNILIKDLYLNYFVSLKPSELHQTRILFVYVKDII